ncbi:MAG: hypothetical protein KatS3mg039_1190 [Candidatus Kapaibacterium sp.]|nr:MAG: hypothetical protein KatS3mg039_1190 [Candidatus Kapabacteria bacterium]
MFGTACGTIGHGGVSGECGGGIGRGREQDGIAVEGVDVVACQGQAVELPVRDTVAGAEYRWYDSSSQEVGRGVVVTVVLDGSCTYVVRRMQGACTGSDTVEVGVYPVIDVRTHDVSVCAGEEAELVLEGNGVRCWWKESDGQVVSSECRYRVRGDVDRQYRGVMEDAHGCWMSSMAWVRVQPRSNVEVSVEPASVEVGAGERAELSVLVRSSSSVSLRDVWVRMRVGGGGVCDVEGSRWEGMWQVVDRRCWERCVRCADSGRRRVAESVGVDRAVSGWSASNNWQWNYRGKCLGWVRCIHG